MSRKKRAKEFAAVILDGVEDGSISLGVLLAELWSDFLSREIKLPLRDMIRLAYLLFDPTLQDRIGDLEELGSISHNKKSRRARQKRVRDLQAATAVQTTYPFASRKTASHRIKTFSDDRLHAFCGHILYSSWCEAAPEVTCKSCLRARPT